MGYLEELETETLKGFLELGYNILHRCSNSCKELTIFPFVTKATPEDLFNDIKQYVMNANSNLTKLDLGKNFSFSRA